MESWITLLIRGMAKLAITASPWIRRAL